LLDGSIAQGVGAFAVADLDAAAFAAPEQALLDADVDEAAFAVEHDAFDVGLIQPRHQRPGCDDGA
jgi:hypothetical protein